MTAVRDTYVNEGATETNYGERSTLLLDGTGGEEKRVLLWFANPFRRVDERIAVTRARLTLHAKGTGWTGTPTVTVKRITETWAEDDVRAATAPATTATNSVDSLLGALSDEDDIVIDLDDMLQDVADGEDWHGVELSIDDAGAHALYSSESSVAGDRPDLDVRYLYAPDEPDNLHPANDQGIANDEPHLRWDFASDTDDDDVSQTYSRVYVSEASADVEEGGTPTYDSGWVANTDEDFHLTAYPGGLVDETEYFWTVQVKDQSGLESDFSDVAAFFYFSGGDLTITAPAANGDAVDDTTPTISHTFTGRTQVFAEYLLWKNEADVEANLIYHRPRRVDAALDFEIPAEDSDGHPLIKREGADYFVDITVWDNKDRGHEDGVTKRRSFIWTNPEDADPVTDLFVSSDGPGLLFEWERSAVPDDFGLFDHETGDLLVRIDATEAHLGGTSYEYRYYDVVPGETREFRIAARTDGAKWSSRTATEPATVAFDVVGIYVLHRSSGDFVHLLGQESGEAVLGQDGETFDLLNRRDVVRVLGGTRGWEVPISGVIAEHGDHDAAYWYRKLISFMDKTSVSGKLHVVFGTRSFPAILQEFSVTQWPNAVEDIYNVAFTAIQVGNFEVDA